MFKQLIAGVAIAAALVSGTVQAQQFFCIGTGGTVGTCYPACA